MQAHTERDTNQGIRAKCAHVGKQTTPDPLIFELLVDLEISSKCQKTGNKEKPISKGGCHISIKKYEAAKIKNANKPFIFRMEN